MPERRREKIGAEHQADPVLLRRPPRELATITSVYLAFALLLGGGGFYYPLLTGALEAGAVLLLVYVALTRGLVSPSCGRFAAALALMIAALPLLHLLPLPPSVWTQLPGREVPHQILALAELDRQWRPLSLDPEATLTSFLELLPAFALFFAACHLQDGERLRLVKIVIGVAILSVVLGGLQKAGGGAGWATLFPSPHSRDAPGLFIDRNHQAAFLLASLPLAAAAARQELARRQGLPTHLVALALLALLSGGVLATTSRTGLLLWPAALLAAMAMIYFTGRSWRIMAVGAALLAGGSLLISLTSGFRRVVDRLAGSAEDDRFEYWADTMVGIQQSWPFGYGIGSFPRAFPSFEDLNDVGSARVYNAHNEYLELLFEGGLAAAVLIVVFVVFLVFKSVTALRQPAATRSAWSVAAIVGVVLIMAFSVGEYPLRVGSIMACFGLLLALFAAMPNPPRPRLNG